jgi:hypothetical protein
MLVDTPPETFTEIQARAAASWRQWAHQLADGGDPPRPVEVLEAGVVLRLAEPMDALQEAAATIAKVGQLEQRAAAARDDRERQLEPFGGEQGLADRIAELTAQLEQLRSLASPWRCLDAGQLAGEADRLRRKNPLLWPATPAAPTPAKKTTSRRRAIA